MTSSGITGVRAQRHFLYFCTSKASKLSTEEVSAFDERTQKLPDQKHICSLRLAREIRVFFVPVRVREHSTAVRTDYAFRLPCCAWSVDGVGHVFPGHARGPLRRNFLFTKLALPVGPTHEQGNRTKPRSTAFVILGFRLGLCIRPLLITVFTGVVCFISHLWNTVLSILLDLNVSREM